MKITCDVIKDLLPLYVEDMVSEDSKALVTEHIADCENCQRRLGEIKQVSVIPQETETAGLARVKKGILNRRLRTALVSILCTATLLFAVFVFLTSPEYLSAEEAIEQITVSDDGTVSIAFKADVADSDFEDANMGGGTEITIIAWKYPFLDIRTSKPLSANYSLIDFDIERIWYSSTGIGEDILLWGEPINGGKITLPRTVLAMYFYIAVLAGAIFTLAAVLMRKMKVGKFLAVVACFLWSFSLADLFVTQGEFLRYDADVKFIYISFLAALLCATVCSAWSLWKLSRQDRAK